MEAQLTRASSVAGASPGGMSLVDMLSHVHPRKAVTQYSLQDAEEGHRLATYAIGVS